VVAGALRSDKIIDKSTTSEPQSRQEREGKQNADRIPKGHGLNILIIQFSLHFFAALR
jgi:hypothetical protein